MAFVLYENEDDDRIMPDKSVKLPEESGLYSSKTTTDSRDSIYPISKPDSPRKMSGESFLYLPAVLSPLPGFDEEITFPRPGMKVSWRKNSIY